MPRRIPVRRIAVAAALAAGLVVPVSASAPAGAAGTVKASVSLTGPGSGVYGSSVTLSGTAWRTGTSTKLVNATIWLQRTAHGGTTWSNVTSTHTSSIGTFSFSVTQGTPYDYRATYGGSATYTAAFSPRVYPAVRQYVRFDSIKDLNWTLGTLEATATVLPVQYSGGTVWLQRYNATTRVWENYISAKTTGSSKVVIRGNVGGTSASFRIYMPQRFSYASGWSSTKQFAHYKWRGAFTRALVDQGGDTDASFYVVSDPEHKDATLQAGTGGTVWGDLNTAGCGRISTLANNLADAAADVSLIGSTNSVTVQVPAAAGRTIGDTISNKATVRLQAEDTTAGSSEGLLVHTETSLLCAN
jgi:hypothetical protein